MAGSGDVARFSFVSRPAQSLTFGGFQAILRRCNIANGYVQASGQNKPLKWPTAPHKGKRGQSTSPPLARISWRIESLKTKRLQLARLCGECERGHSRVRWCLCMVDCYQHHTPREGENEMAAYSKTTKAGFIRELCAHGWHYVWCGLVDQYDNSYVADCLNEIYDKIKGGDIVEMRTYKHTSGNRVVASTGSIFDVNKHVTIYKFEHGFIAENKCSRWAYVLMD